jgi:hypothetical protein
MDWANHNSGAITGLATLLLVIITAVYAWFARQTVKEMRRDRTYANRPAFRWQVGGGAWVEGANYGLGPALNTICLVVSSNGWRRTDLFDISADETTVAHPNAPMLLQGDQAKAPSSKVVGRTISVGEDGLVALCQDRFGNRYRFRGRDVLPDVWHRRDGRLARFRLWDREPEWSSWYSDRLI